MLSFGDGLALAGFMLAVWGSLVAILKYKSDIKTPHNGGSWVSKEVWQVVINDIRADICEAHKKLDTIIRNTSNGKH